MVAEISYAHAAVARRWATEREHVRNRWLSHGQCDRRPGGPPSLVASITGWL